MYFSSSICSPLFLETLVCPPEKITEFCSPHVVSSFTPVVLHMLFHHLHLLFSTCCFIIYTCCSPHVVSSFTPVVLHMLFHHLLLLFSKCCFIIYTCCSPHVVSSFTPVVLHMLFHHLLLLFSTCCFIIYTCCSPHVVSSFRRVVLHMLFHHLHVLFVHVIDTCTLYVQIARRRAASSGFGLKSGSKQFQHLEFLPYTHIRTIIDFTDSESECLQHMTLSVSHYLHLHTFF